VSSTIIPNEEEHSQANERHDERTPYDRTPSNRLAPPPQVVRSRNIVRIILEYASPQYRQDVRDLARERTA
jgi:hypothetical protein